MRKCLKIALVLAALASSAACEQSPSPVPVAASPAVKSSTTTPYQNQTTRPGQQLPTAPPPSTQTPFAPVGGSTVPSRPSNGQSSQDGLLSNFINALGGNGDGGSTRPPSGPSSPTTPTVGGDVYQLCMKTINDYRATVNSPALTLNSAKNSCSDAQTGKDGQGGGAHANFGECGEMAQDECPGWGDGDQAEALTGCLKMMWDEGPGGGHYENMKNASYRSMACGFKLVNGSLWMVQNFYP